MQITEGIDEQPLSAYVAPARPQRSRKPNDWEQTVRLRPTTGIEIGDYTGARTADRG